MEQEKNKNNGLVVLVVFLCLIILGLGGYIVYDKVLSNKETSIVNVQTNESNNVGHDENQKSNVIGNDKSDNNSNNNSKYNNTIDDNIISLKNQIEDVNFHDLRLHFRGSKIDNQDTYHYSLDIYLNGKMLNTHFFSDYNYLKISNDFYAYLIDDIYVLRAFIPRQGYTSDVLIFDKNGKILKAFQYVDFSIENGKINITDPDYAYNTYIGSMAQDDQKKSMMFIKKYTYTINGLNLIEQ